MIDANARGWPTSAVPGNAAGALLFLLWGADLLLLGLYGVTCLAPQRAALAGSCSAFDLARPDSLPESWATLQALASAAVLLLLYGTSRREPLLAAAALFLLGLSDGFSPHAYLATTLHEGAWLGSSGIGLLPAKLLAGSVFGLCMLVPALVLACVAGPTWRQLAYRLLLTAVFLLLLGGGLDLLGTALNPIGPRFAYAVQAGEELAELLLISAGCAAVVGDCLDCPAAADHLAFRHARSINQDVSLWDDMGRSLLLNSSLRDDSALLRAPSQQSSLKKGQTAFHLLDVGDDAVIYRGSHAIHKRW